MLGHHLFENSLVRHSPACQVQLGSSLQADSKCMRFLFEVDPSIDCHEAWKDQIVGTIAEAVSLQLAF